MSFHNKTSKANILDRPLSRGKGEVSLSAFAFLFSEIIQYCQNRVDSIPALEKKLAEIGNRVGVRMLELLVYREKGSKRETKLLNILYFINSVVWKSLFGKQADLLEKENTEHDDTYMISDVDLLVNKYISVPKEMGGLNCAAFVAGIVEAILNGTNFPARVTAHATEKGTTILMKFDHSVMAREKAMDA
eukprot:Colp12_sorted_trinity150504_noHs@16135